MAAQEEQLNSGWNIEQLNAPPLPCRGDAFHYRAKGEGSEQVSHLSKDSEDSQLSRERVNAQAGIRNSVAGSFAPVFQFYLCVYCTRGGGSLCPFSMGATPWTLDGPLSIMRFTGEIM